MNTIAIAAGLFAALGAFFGCLVPLVALISLQRTREQVAELAALKQELKDLKEELDEPICLAHPDDVKHYEQ